MSGARDTDPREREVLNAMFSIRAALPVAAADLLTDGPRRTEVLGMLDRLWGKAQLQALQQARADRGMPDVDGQELALDQRLPRPDRTTLEQRVDQLEKSMADGRWAADTDERLLSLETGQKRLEDKDADDHRWIGEIDQRITELARRIDEILPSLRWTIETAAQRVSRHQARTAPSDGAPGGDIVRQHCAGCGLPGTTQGLVPLGMVALHWVVRGRRVCIECHGRQGAQ